MVSKKVKRPKKIRRKVKFLKIPFGMPLINLKDLSCECDTFEEDVCAKNDFLGGIDDMMPKALQRMRKQKK